MLKQNKAEKAVIGLFFLFIAITFLKGQTETNPEHEKITLLGQILDNNNNTIEYANVLLLSLPYWRL